MPSAPPSRPTIRMVAQRAAVSTATVSYVLSGRAGGAEGPGIAPATIARVRAAADALGYHPNQAARTIRTGRSNLVILSLTMLADPWALAMAQAVQGRLSGHGITPMILADADWEAVLDRQHADAIFIDNAPATPDMARTLKRLSRRTGRLIVFNETDLEPDGFDVVRSPSVPGCKLAVQHLLERHSKVGALAFSRSKQTMTPTRFDMYVEALDEAGIAYREDYVELHDQDPVSAFDAAVRLLRRDDRPTAIFAVTDFVAISAVRAAHWLGLRVPQDVAVIGAGNNPDGATMEPSLSSVGPDDFFTTVSSMIARRATGEDDSDGKLLEFPWHVFARDSTRGDDPAHIN